MTAPFPIISVRQELECALNIPASRWILTAPTGSGKSTQVPQMILDSGAMDPGKEVVVMEPRRIAARMLATWVAKQRGSIPGAEVGYQVRLDARVSAQTRIRYITEGILLRRIVDDPDLKTVGAVLLDEFHERHLYGDLLLAWAKRLQETRRPDLIIGVMSATIETGSLAKWLAPVRVIEGKGSAFPVEIEYAGGVLVDPQKPVWDRVVESLRRFSEADLQGDTLVFLPGTMEIRRTIRLLQEIPAFSRTEILPLYGDLSPEEQDRAVRGGGARPRIIVATNVAETSITIDGITRVIDSGLARMARYDPRRGIDSLLVEPISRSSADQRAGRAGRTQPGSCLRLWRKSEHTYRPLEDTPEIGRVDLAETVLFLKSLGEGNLEGFPWFEKPDPVALERARTLLEDLGAIHRKDGAITGTGLRMARFPMHPRYARMMLYASDHGCLPTIALLAALGQERSVLAPIRDRKAQHAREAEFRDVYIEKSDFFFHLRAWQWAREQGFDRGRCESLGIRARAALQAGHHAGQFLAVAKSAGLDVETDRFDEAVIRKTLLIGFADHLGVRMDRGTRRCRLVHGRIGELRRESVVDRAPLMVFADMEEVGRGGQTKTLLGMATEVERDWLGELYPDAFDSGDRVRFDPDRREVIAEEQVRFGDLVLECNVSGDPPEDEAARLLATEVREGRLTLKTWDAEVDRWIRRVNFAVKAFPAHGIAEIDEAGMQFVLESLFLGARRYREIRDREILPALKSWLPGGMDVWLDQAVPGEVRLPVRNRPFRIEYDAEQVTATIGLTIQDLYDLDPVELVIGDGKIPLRVEILAPNRRPVQIMMADRLSEFWEGSYPAIKKELKGRYPKHAWR